MPKYVVGFKIENAKELVAEDDDLCNPFVLVECYGKQYQTTVTENSSGAIVTWDSVLQMWPDIEMSEEEFETAYIEFNVYSRNYFVRNYLIGKASLQLSSINQRSNHLYSKKKVSLARPNQTDRCGIITITAFCLKPGDRAPNVEEPEEENEGEEDDIDLAKQVVGHGDPTMDEGMCYNVSVDILRVETVEPCYPFVTVEFNSKTLRTNSVTSLVDKQVWNVTAMIPVQMPLYEDTILIKLWSEGNAFAFRRDELLAQGVIYFTELVNTGMHEPRWFNLYGWDPEEVPDLNLVSAYGIPPNVFKGRLLLSGKVERLNDGKEALEQDNIVPMRSPGSEPPTSQVQLLSDVTRVTGAVGHECRVEIAFMREVAGCEWINATGYKIPGGDNLVKEKSNKMAHLEADELVVYEWKSQKAGRIPPLRTMVPQEEDYQAALLINVRTRGVFSKPARMAYKWVNLSSIERYRPDIPAKPRNYAMELMPTSGDQKPITVLMTLESHDNIQEVARHARKNQKPSNYIVRAYVFMARNIKIDRFLEKNLAIRVSCAGMSLKTETKKMEVRPMWMKCLELNVLLSSDHPRTPPTMEQIHVTLVDIPPVSSGLFSDIPLASVGCTYEYMRTKNDLGEWDKFRIKPQWIELRGGDFGSQVKGEVLIAFELLHSKGADTEPALRVKDMWPANENVTEVEEFEVVHQVESGGFVNKMSSMFGAGKSSLDQVPFEDWKDVAYKKVQMREASGWLLRMVNARNSSGEELLRKSEKLRFYNELEKETDRPLRMYDWDRDQQLTVGLPMIVTLTFERCKVPCSNRERAPKIRDRVIRAASRSIFLDTPDVSPQSDNWFLLKGEVATVCAVDNRENCFKLKNPKGTESPWLHNRFFDFMPEIVGDDPDEAFSKLKRATLFFSFYGLRDLKVNDREDNAGITPVVDVRIKKFQDPAAVRGKHTNAFQDTFIYKGASQDSDEQVLKWQTSAFESVWKKPCWNYEFFDTKKIELELPDQNVLEPFLTVNVSAKKVSSGMTDFFESSTEDYDIRVSLSSMYPCIWFDRIKIGREYDNQRPLLKKEVESSLNKGQAAFVARDSNQQSGGEGEDLAIQDEDEDDADADQDMQPIEAEIKKADEFSSMGVPRELEMYIPVSDVKEGKFDIANEHGYQDENKPDQLGLKDDILNMQVPDTFAPPNVEAGAKANEEPAALPASEVKSKLEDDMRYSFPYRSRPLFKKGMKDIEPNIFANDWNFDHKSCMGFVKFHAKLVHGWEEGNGEEEDLSEDAIVRDANMILKEEFQKEHRVERFKNMNDEKQRQRKQERKMLMQTVDLLNGSDDPTMIKYRKWVDTWAWNSDQFMKEHKEQMKSRIRLRLYFYQGICITGSTKHCDPYLSYGLPAQPTVNMSDQAKYDTNLPDWGGESREIDIELPIHHRLEIKMLDMPDAIDKLKNDFGLGTDVIGFTVIDLEDRWHFNCWKRYKSQGASRKAKDPIEIRELTVPGKTFENNGSLSIRIEMFKSEAASEFKAIPKMAQAETKVEVRIVVWECEKVLLVDNGKTDAKITCKIAADAYDPPPKCHCPCPIEQETDVHQNCTDGAPEFNWRFLYPEIDMDPGKTKNCLLTFTLWDSNLLSSDTRIGEVIIDIIQFARKVARTQETLTVEKSKLVCTVKDETTGDLNNVGTIICDMQILAQPTAETQRNAPGRNDPNDFPMLTTPEAGRSIGDMLAGFDFSGAFGGLGLLKKVLPIIIFLLASLILLKWLGLL